jgi:hypothetical protein
MGMTQTVYRACVRFKEAFQKRAAGQGLPEQAGWLCDHEVAQPANVLTSATSDNKGGCRWPCGA